MAKDRKIARYGREARKHIKAMYESGIYKSVEDIARVYREQHAEAPSITTIERWAGKYSWSRRGAVADAVAAVEDAAETEYKKWFGQLGLSRKRVAELTREMCESIDYKERDRGLGIYMKLTGDEAPRRLAASVDNKGDTNTVVVMPANGFEPAAC